MTSCFDDLFTIHGKKEKKKKQNKKRSKHKKQTKAGILKCGHHVQNKSLSEKMPSCAGPPLSRHRSNFNHRHKYCKHVGSQDFSGYDETAHMRRLV